MEGLAHILLGWLRLAFSEEGDIGVPVDAVPLRGSRFELCACDALPLPCRAFTGLWTELPQGPLAEDSTLEAAACRTLEIRLFDQLMRRRVASHREQRNKQPGNDGDTHGWALTFDMSGVTRQAKPAVARPLDGGVRRHVQLPIPNEEKGKQMQAVAFGKSMPSTTPTATEPTAHQPTASSETGKVPSMTLPSTPIQKHPNAPTTEPRTRSLRVGGVHHHSRNCSFRRLMKNALGMVAPNVGGERQTPVGEARRWLSARPKGYAKPNDEGSAAVHYSRSSKLSLLARSNGGLALHSAPMPE
jgi:hypothetical protein